MTDAAPPANAAQIDYWNAKAGETWARFQEQLDRQIAPLGDAGIRALAPQPGERILDIGCGCGQTTLALATEVTPGGSVLGLDISKPMLDVARKRAVGVPNVAFRDADAQTDDFGRNGFDAVFSRFGVMFFADPTAAFANIATKLVEGGRLTFVCWRPLAENDWMRVPLEAALPLLPPLPPSDPLAPGPFAFANPDRVHAILSGSGWHSVNIEKYDAEIGSGDLAATVDMTFRVGPLGMALRENPDRVAPVAEAVRKALASYDGPDGVKLPAAVWIVQAMRA
ncbi:class I SAM-dependent methyltransferase [Polymorphobacter arshaanensis]|nr:methyltransferase domain-containing protein [Polymorphobacter arshaanensis]